MAVLLVALAVLILVSQTQSTKVAGTEEDVSAEGDSRVESDVTDTVDRFGLLPEKSRSLPATNLIKQSTASEATKSWYRSVGFTTEYNIHFLNREFLEEQAANDDMLAAQLLGYQMMGSTEGDAHLVNAARLGSVQALHFLSNSYLLKAQGSLTSQRESSISSIDQQDASVRALEYLFVAQIRGDNFTASHRIDRLLEEITYTDEDVARACNDAVYSYALFEKERLDQGIARFDNAPSQDGSDRTRFSSLCENK